MDFKKRYNKLNEAQKNAVDTIDGPVMVIAGPGTGKTELLSVRIANILDKTDTLPEDILCLTFTESGATAMRERLTEIIGKDAYKVCINTFHGFGSEVINQNSEFFYRGANFRPADELSSYEIIRDIFDNLSHKSQIIGQKDGEYVYLRDTLSVISEIKRSGLTSDELLKVLEENDLAIAKTERLLEPVLANRISKKTIEQLSSLPSEIRNSEDKKVVSTINRLSDIIADSLENAVNESINSGKTQSVTAWKKDWIRKDDKGNIILKSHKSQQTLREICYVYSCYLSEMDKAGLYDFDDMILNVVHALETNSELRFNLQEKYLYIMVDEFQDTNMAQMRILNSLVNNEVNADMPNIMVVGDDDQAIYSFQGAEISNILDFEKNYPRVRKITLIENYRSAPIILDGAREVILQGKDRLENIYADINKQLAPNCNPIKPTANIYEASIIASERHWLVNNIKRRIELGQEPGSIAVLTRRHHEINSLLPYFDKANISVNYERQDNVLDLEPINMVYKLAKLVVAIASSQFNIANEVLPEILTHKSWGIDPSDIYNLSLTAYKERKLWLETMASSPKFTDIYQWLIECSAESNNESMELMLDKLIGIPQKDTAFVSPLYDFFFSEKNLNNNPSQYLSYLDGLRTIRTKLREYRPDQMPSLKSFVDYVDLSKKTGSVINSSRKQADDQSKVNILTAHKSKGLEFDTVYIVNAVDNNWGESARSKPRYIGYPENLELAPAGENEDERLRLFYVAITRAKRELIISYSQKDDKDKNTLRVGFLLNSKWPTVNIIPSSDLTDVIEASELAWNHQFNNSTSADIHDVLMSTLTDYKLSVTHLHSFLDVTRGGPAEFLLQNLLHFPKAKSSQASYGTAIHETLQQAHSSFSLVGAMQPVEDIVSIFESSLKNQRLPQKDYEHYAEKGGDDLRIFIEQTYDSFSVNQKTELNFSNQHSIINETHITGKLDLVDINKSDKTVSVTDYKTGKPLQKWYSSDEYEKIKAHKYKQQLLFYKLLVENARDYRGYTVENGIMQFVEPTKQGEIAILDTDYNEENIEQFIKLINAVWDHIITLNLPDISKYEKSYKGILAFEQDLIDGII
jgi:DNA helicase-2/ATP-dependent DNA helicase PcrA